MRAGRSAGRVGHGAVPQTLEHGGEGGLVRVAGGEGQSDPADADAHHGSQFEDVGMDGGALRPGPAGTGQSQAPQAGKPPNPRVR